MRSAIRAIFPTNPNFAGASHQFFSRHFSSKLFVKGLPFSMTEEMLANAFSEFGNVVQAQVVMNKDKKKSKGFGYVTFKSEDQAQKALAGTNGKLMHGRVLFVDVENAKG
ncbi:Small RNA-binding protein 11, chloroplastic [Linum perenne]